MSKFLVSLFTVFLCSSAIAQAVFVPKANVRLAASDLVGPDGNIVDQEKAYQLGLDLSKLDPVETELWSNKPVRQSDDLDVPEGQVMDFDQHLLAANDTFRFVAKTSSGSSVTFLGDQNLVATLVRKNLLRKLGYKIPPMQRVASVRLQFGLGEKGVRARKEAVSLMRGTLVTKSLEDWIVARNEPGPNEQAYLDMVDLCAIDLSGGGGFNLARGVPTDTLNTRVLRALALPYALTALDESVNALPWTTGRWSEDGVTLPSFFSANSFDSTTWDDAIWIASRIKSLGVSDFEQIVGAAQLPKAVHLLFVNKLIARRNHMLRIFEQVGPGEHLPYELMPNYAKELVKGELKVRDWKRLGYASRFARMDATSPFKKFHYYFYGLLQSIGIDSVVAQFNSKLRAFDPTEARFELARKEFIQGLEYFIQTGRFLDFPVSHWTSPKLNGDLILSRSVVAGNVQGTDNLIQMADTFGFAVDGGFITGFENVDHANNVIVQGGVRYVRTFTHLRPLKDLKDVFRVDYTNMIVPVLRYKLKALMKNTLERYNEINATGAREILLDQLGEEFRSEIEKDLGPEESLLITDRIIPNVSGSFELPLGPFKGTPYELTLSAGAGANHAIVRRLQIFKNPVNNAIQIFKDKGRRGRLQANLSISAGVPIMRLRHLRDKGRYEMRSYFVDLQGKIEAGSELLDRMHGLRRLLTTGRVDELERSVTPVVVNGRFRDQTSHGALLMFRGSRFKALGEHKVSVGKRVGNYISYRDTKRRGLNWESFFKDAINMQLAELLPDVQWNNFVFDRPQATLLGQARSREIYYDAQIKEGGALGREYLSVSYRYEGFSKRRKAILKRVKKLNKVFKKQIFDDQMLAQIKGLRLYDMRVRLSLYSPGISRLKKLTRESLIHQAAVTDQNELKDCDEAQIRSYRVRRRWIRTCGSMARSIRLIRRCNRMERRKRKLRRRVRCWAKLAGSMVESMPVETITKLLGQDGIYLSGRIDGFRKRSEILNAPIIGHSFGRRDPKIPFGILASLRARLGIRAGEFEGFWIRERP